MDYPTTGFTSPSKLIAYITYVFLFISMNINAQNNSLNNHDCLDHKHGSEVSNEKLKEAAFELILPHMQQSLSNAIKNAKIKQNDYLTHPATCFAPGTDPAVIENYYANAQGSGLGNSGGGSSFNINSRWLSTATDGGGLAQGDITTLTWSYVPDGTTIGNGGCQLPDAGTFSSDVITFFNGIFGPPTTPGDFTTAPWHTIFIDMFDSWSSETGLTFVYEPMDDGATNCLASNPGLLGIRGDMRISGHLIDGNSGVLACNYFPTSSGDMILDTGDNFYSNNPGTGTFNVLAHEIGHGLGLSHVCPVNSTKLMEPFVNTAFMGPQEDDLLGVNRNYGDSDEVNDTNGGATNLGSDPLPASYQKMQRSIDDNGDEDFFSFTTGQAAMVSVELIPIGSTYLEGVQNPNGSCSAGSNFDAMSVADLMLEIIDTDGVTVLAISNSTGAGENESVTALNITAGTYSVSISQQGPTVNDVQMYDLSVALVAAVVDPCDTDIEDPTIACPADTILDNDVGECSAVFDYIIDTDDNCMVDGDPIQTEGLPSGSQFPVGTTANTYIVTDVAGNTAECNFMVTIVDTELPSAVCQDVTLSLDENGEATIAGGTTTMVNGVELGAPSQLPSDIISPICGPVAAVADICDCPTGYVATGIEGLESTDFGGLVGEFNIICRQLLPTGNLGSTSMVTCSNGTANTTTALGPVATTGDNVLVAAQSRIGCAVDRITIYSAPMAQVLAGNNTPNTEVGFLAGSNGGTGGGLRPLRTAPNNNVIIGMQTFDNQGNPSYTAGIAWRYAPIEEVLVESSSAFLIDGGSGDNCTEDEDLIFMVSQSDFTCDDLIAGQASTDIVVTLIVTDAAGNVSMCDATVTIMDDTAPSITCPANINIALDAGDCDRIIDFTVLASDNCRLVPDAEGNTIIQTAGLPSGSVYERGTTTNTFEVTDPTGNVSTCSFDVVILEFSDPIESLICNGELNISLDQNCEAFIGADQILEGGPYGCYDDFTVEISGITGQTILAPGTYTVTITDPDTGNSCWSEVTVEDKLEPTLMCTDCPPGATMPIELPFVGTLDVDSPIWTRPFGQPANCAPSGAGVNVPYNTHEFLVVTGADSDFENVSFTAPSNDFFMALYQDNFDPLNPCGNMIINNDDGGAGFLSQFDVMLESGTQYILVATTFNNNGNDFGDYVIELDSDAILVDAPLECLFKCFDEAAILSGILSVPSAVAMDNCTANLPTTFNDVVTDGPICGSKVITRTFSIIGDDGSVLTSCVAEYQLFAVQFTDFVLPPVSVSLPCGSGTSPAEIEAFFDDPTTNDINNPNCPLDVLENNEGTTFGYITYPTIGCDGNEHLQAVDNNQCGFFTTYSDLEIPTCGVTCGSSNVKVIRTWTILDWCNADTAPFTYVQVIESADNEAPTIEVADDFGVSVNPWNCLGDFSLPAPTLLHDLCSSDITYTISGPVGTTLLSPNTTSNPSENWIVFGVPRGLSEFTYTATDCCGNTANAVLRVNVFDTTPPEPVAVENVIINLTTSGQTDENDVALGSAKVFWNSIDDGSFDGCSDVKIEIARELDACDVSGNDTFNADGHPDDGSPNPNASNYDPDGGEFVMFCCADIDQVDPNTGVEFGIVPVRMRVFDDGNGTGFFGDFIDNNGDGDVLDAGEYDNFNETWANVRVEGKSIPSLVCPPDVTLNCDMDYTDATMIGNATSLNLCGAEVVSVSFTPQLNACGIGFVIATYTIDDSSPTISCSQRITIENQFDAFDPDGIIYPRNLPTSPTGQLACSDDINFDAPTWTAGPCDFIGYTEDVDTFFFETDPNTGAGQNACFKILRTFTVIDWCVYDETNGQDGLYVGTQTIKITDREAPVLLSCENVMFGVDDNEDANENGNICEKIGVTLTNSAIDNGDCASDWLKWQVFVDTWGDGIIDYEYSSFLPSNDSNINNDTNGNGINDRYLEPTSSEQEVGIFVPETIESSMFNHVVNWKVTDGCGNVSSCTTTFMVVDKKAPTPYCISVHTALMADPDGDGPLLPMVEIWAKDFDLGAFDNCTDQEDLLFTFGDSFPVLTLLDEEHFFKGEGQLATEAEYLAGNAQFWDPVSQTSGMVFDCNDRPAVTIIIRVTDEKGNSNSCVVFIGIIDNNEGCEQAGSKADIVGSISTATGEFVQGTQVNLDALLPEFPRSTETIDGEFAFADNDLFIDYDVTATLNDNPSNGVSTLDLVLIQRHIIGLANLDSPYKVVAADISNDEKISAIDVIELRKVILGVQNEFNAVESWRFVDAAQDFADIVSPWPVDYSVDVDHLDANISNANMIAVKMGDVNDTYTSLTSQSIDTRTDNVVTLSVAEAELVANTEGRIEITTDEQLSTQGLQMTIELNDATPLTIESSLVGFGDANYSVNGNLVSISWNTNAIQTVDAGEALFTIITDVESNTSISDAITISDRKLRSEVYVGESLDINNVALVVRDGTGSEVAITSKTLLQNEPNPFTNETTISYYLDSAESSATIKVIDVMGKVIYSQSVNAEKGWNTHTISQSDLSASGVYYYQLEAGNFSERKSMILVK